VQPQPTVIVVLSLAGTVAFGLSGGMAAVRARLDVFGVAVLAVVVGLSGGIIRDLLIGRPPQAFRDWRYIVAAAATGLVCFFLWRTIERLHKAVQVFDALGLALFCVTGASAALAAGIGPALATVLGAITGIGGGMLRDVFLREVPAVLSRDLYAVPALLGASVVTIAHAAGSDSGVWAIVGAAVCFVLRMAGIRFGLRLPVAMSVREGRSPDGADSADAGGG
jgi:uncharacterized membrane protein YeiH